MGLISMLVVSMHSNLCMNKLSKVTFQRFFIIAARNPWIFPACSAFKTPKLFAAGRNVGQARD